MKNSNHFPAIESYRTLDNIKISELKFVEQYENPTEMLTCWIECKTKIKDKILNEFSDKNLLQSLENARNIWEKTDEESQEEITELRIKLADPANTEDDKIRIREEIVEYFYDIFFEIISQEQADLPYKLTLEELKKITAHCVTLLETPSGTIFDFSDENAINEEIAYAEEVTTTKDHSPSEITEFVRSTIMGRLMN